MTDLIERDVVATNDTDPAANRGTDGCAVVETSPDVDLAFSGRDRRRHRRYAVSPMFAPIRIRDEQDRIVDGHVHDISITGARFESDREFEADERVRFELELPGRAATLRGSARIVRQQLEHEATGDMLVGIEFERFEDRIVSATLTRFLEQGCLVRAA